MKKKMVSAMLCTMMVTGMFVGCGSSDSDTGTETTTNDTATDDTATDDTATDDTTDTSDAAEADDSAADETENTVTGDAKSDDAFVIWGWNDDIKKLLDGPFKEKYPDLYKRIVFVNTGGSDTYQTKIDEILDDSGNELYPDMMGLEVDYVLKYVSGDNLTSVEDLGIKEDEYKEQYQYNIDLGTSEEDGKVKALFWQATPGCIQIRADLAEKYLGTTDQKELQDKYFSSWDKIMETGKTLSEKSNGACKLFSGTDDVFRIFSNSRTTGWYDDNDVITIDPNMDQYMDIAKELHDKDYTFNTTQWEADWNANMSGETLAYQGCPWFTYWCLNDTWNNNTILVEGPQQFYWGGTGLAATANCSDKDMAATIMRFFTCEKDSMKEINATNSDFINNRAALDEISKEGSAAKCEKLFDKDFDMIGFYKPLAEKIDASTATAEDQTINQLWDTQVKSYINGDKDKETAINDFKASVHDTYSYLKVE